MDLYAHLRSTATISTSPINYRDRHALLTAYDPSTSLAYLAGLMPSIYGATVHVLNSTKNRLKLISDWEPERIIDFGSGTGSAAWAVQEVWGAVDSAGRVREYTGLDGSKAMIELSSTVIGALPNDSPTSPPSSVLPKILARTHQLPIPCSTGALSKLKLSPTSSHPISGKRTMALASFTLGDLGTKEKRRDVVRGLWDTDAEIIVIIDRGTPAGSRMVLEAREQLLTLGRRSLERESIESGSQAEKGCFVLAPVSVLLFD